MNSDAANRKYIVHIVLNIYPCSIGGLEIFYSKLLPEMSHKLDVLLITGCQRTISCNFPVVKIRKRFLSIPGTGKFAGLFFSALKLISLRKQIKIVHLPYTANSGRWGFVLPFLKYFFGVKYLLHLHGGGMKKWKPFDGNRALVKHANKLIAVSDVIKNEYQKRSGRKIEVVLPLVPHELAKSSREILRQKLNIDPQEIVILFVGSLKELKAPDVLLEAFSQLGREFIRREKLRVIFVGDGKLREKLERAVNEQDLSEYVNFAGIIPHANIADYYKIADLYVITSHFEGTPNSLLEAMFNKLAIVGSDVNGINNILTHGQDSLLFEKNNSGDLNAKLLELLGNREKWDSLGEAAYKKYLERFSFNETVNKFIEVYQ